MDNCYKLRYPHGSTIFGSTDERLLRVAHLRDTNLEAETGCACPSQSDSSATPLAIGSDLPARWKHGTWWNSKNRLTPNEKKHSVHIKAASTWVVTASSSPTSLSTCAQSHMRWSMDLSPRNGTWWHMETEGSSKSLQNLSTTRKIENQWHVQAVKPPPIDRPAKSASEAAQAPSENQEMTLDFEVQNGSTNHLMLSNAI